MDERTDEELIGACRRGDGDAYAGLVGRYSKRLFAVCLGIVGDFHDAEDMAQEAFIKAFARIHGLRDAAQFFPWLRKIANNLCMDFFRARKSGEVLVADPPDEPDPRATIPPEHLDLKNAIAKLPEDLRLPLVLYYFAGRRTKGIAQLLEISEAGVHTRLSRARKELRLMLSEKEETR